MRGCHYHDSIRYHGPMSTLHGPIDGGLLLPRMPSGALSPLGPQHTPVVTRIAHYNRNLGLITLPEWPQGPDLYDFERGRPAVLLWGKVFDLARDTDLGQQGPILREFFSQTLLGRWSHYQFEHMRIRTVPGVAHEHREASRIELELWQSYVDAQIRQRILPYIALDDGTRADDSLFVYHQRAHWYWCGATKGDRPAVDWLGTQSVPIYRILWVARVRREERLLDIERPRKNKDACLDAGNGRLCVNPYHFERAKPMRAGSNGRTRRFQADSWVRTFRPRWVRGMEMRDPDGNYYIPCPNDFSHGALQGGTQERYRRGDESGQGRCPKCYQRWKETSIPVADARPYAGRNRGPRAIVHMQDQAKQEIEASEEKRDLLLKTIQGAVALGEDPEWAEAQAREMLGLPPKPGPAQLPAPTHLEPVLSDEEEAERRARLDPDLYEV